MLQQSFFGFALVETEISIWPRYVGPYNDERPYLEIPAPIFVVFVFYGVSVLTLHFLLLEGADIRPAGVV